MLTRFFAITLIAAAVAGCNSSSSRRAPSLTAAPASTLRDAPPKRGFFEEAGDTTWRVVTAPTRLIPPKKPITRAPAETFEAPSGLIIRRTLTDESEPLTSASDTQPPATQPASP